MRKRTENIPDGQGLPQQTDETIVPTWRFMAERICDALSTEEVRAQLTGDDIEIETENAHGILLHLSEGASDLSLWTTILLATPKSSSERAEALNALNEQSLGARFYQAGEDDAIDVAQNHLIGKAGLDASTAVRFVEEFAQDVERAEEHLLEAGFYEDPDTTNGTFYKEGR